MENQKSLPQYGSREIGMILSCVHSMDPHPITSCIKRCIKSNTKISILHLTSEIYICKKITLETGGTHNVPMNEVDISSILSSWSNSEMRHNSLQISPNNHRWIPMAFPVIINQSFTCPNCFHFISFPFSLPLQCPSCKILISKFRQLSSTYNHLVKGPSWIPKSCSICYGCKFTIANTSSTSNEDGYSCTSCNQTFCKDCYLICSNVLNKCLGCID